MNPLVFIRTDASLKIGSGHVMRCLTLAEALRDQGVVVKFICRAHLGNLNDLIIRKGFDLTELPRAEASDHTETVENDPRGEYEIWLGVSQKRDAKETITVIEGVKPDWLIVDHYALDQQWEQALRPHAHKIMVLDDLADRYHDCDVLLDQNYFADRETRYNNLLSPASTKLLSPKYALLRKEFALAREKLKLRTGEVKSVLVFLGGTDPDNVAGRALEALSSPELIHLKVDVVIGSQNQNQDTIKELVAIRPNAKLHMQVENMAEMMASTDLAIGAGGSTTWERLCLGLPTVVIPIAENQKELSENLQQLGVIVLMDCCGRAVELKATLLALMNDAQRLVEISRKGMEVVNGNGSELVANFLLRGPEKETLTLRKATSEDCALYWIWANDSEVRKNAFNSKPISWESHQKWFEQKLKDPLASMMVMDSPLGSVGQVRFDGNSDEKIISYSIGRQFRGMGLGKQLIKLAINKEGRSAKKIIAEVKNNNFSSVNIFKKLGFLQRDLANKNAFQYILETNPQC